MKGTTLKYFTIKNIKGLGESRFKVIDNVITSLIHHFLEIPISVLRGFRKDIKDGPISL